MSGTKLASQKALATSLPAEALLIAAHGDRGGARDNVLANAIASAVACTDRFCDIGIGYVRGAPDLATAASKLRTSNLRVYPLFMSDGYYVRTAIPKRLSGIRTAEESPKGKTIIMPPLGASERMPDVLNELAVRTAKQAGLTPNHCSVVLVAHGSSKDDCSRCATERMANTIRQKDVFRGLHTAYLEEAPYLDDQLGSLPGPLIVVGLFIGLGMHGGEDLTDAFNRSMRSDIYLSQPIAHSLLVRKAIVEDLIDCRFTIPTKLHHHLLENDHEAREVT